MVSETNMPTNSDAVLALPSAPSNLCFNKDEFMQSNFNVESFLVECRRRVSLENLRGDLKIYLKVVQSAMIELINKDYADFVNLSTNLVGLDKAINSLMLPLGQLQQDVVKVKNEMDQAIENVQQKIRKQTDISQKKARVSGLRSIIHSVEKMELLLGIQAANDTSVTYPCQLNGQLIERVATQFNKLQFFVNKSRGQALVEEIKPRIANITTTLQYSLERSFETGLETHDVAVLRQCLRTYATIDKLRDAENLVRIFCVKPYMEEVITENYISTNGNGLQGMFNAVLDFIPKHCKILKDVTSGNIPGGGEVIRGYDFIVYAVWPEVISNIDAKIAYIFAPGNPSTFHQKYCMGMDFLDRFEAMCGSQASVRRLRVHPSYNAFLSKWSLPVYFQIRFQEIAGNFESTLALPLLKNEGGSQFHLKATEALWFSLTHCWKPDVYLPALSHRFWKLNLQLLSRYNTWLTYLVDNHMVESKMEQMTTSSSTASLSSYAAKAESQAESTNGKTTEEKANMLKPDDAVLIIADTMMLNKLLSMLFEDNIKDKFQRFGLKDSVPIRDALKEQQTIIEQNTIPFENFVKHEIGFVCINQLKNVNDIPRLYRRTNREKPNKASAFVESLINPVLTFKTDYSSVIEDEKLNTWTKAILQTILEQYENITSDVLTSVKKMEESLKRLKQKKKSENKGLSDDDKIRLQLLLDVTEFGKRIESMGLSRESIEGYKSLFQLVESHSQA